MLINIGSEKMKSDKELAREPYNRPEDYNNLTQEQKYILQQWIQQTLRPIRSRNDKHTSYGIKHIFESSPNGFYITNGQMKGALRAAGFQEYNTLDINWYYNISETSFR